MNNKSTLEQDLALLKQGEAGHPGTPLPFMMRMAVVYRSENKKILRSQINLIQKIIKVLRTAETVLLGRTEPGKEAVEEEKEASEERVAGY